MRALLPALRRSRAGRVVNIASTEGSGATIFGAAYTAAKRASVGLTRAMAVELGSQGNITCNCIQPGPVRTGMTGPIPERQKRLFARRLVPLRRLAPRVAAEGVVQRRRVHAERERALADRARGAALLGAARAAHVSGGAASAAAGRHFRLLESPQNARSESARRQVGRIPARTNRRSSAEEKEEGEEGRQEKHNTKKEKNRPGGPGVLLFEVRGPVHPLFAFPFCIYLCFFYFFSKVNSSSTAFIFSCRSAMSASLFSKTRS